MRMLKDGKYYAVKMKVPIAFIIGDCEGHDKLCGRFGTHHLENAMVCRDCDCSTSQSDEPNVSCSPMLAETIKNLAGDLCGLQANIPPQHQKCF